MLQAGHPLEYFAIFKQVSMLGTHNTQTALKRSVAKSLVVNEFKKPKLF